MITSALALLAVSAAMLASAGAAGAATIKVTTTADEYGAGPGCSLREAITAANTDAPYGGCPAGSGSDDVRLGRGSAYERSLDGNGEDGNATGDLDVASVMSIGPRKGRATLDANSFDRGIEVLNAGDLELSRVTLTGASETYPAALVDGTGVKVSGGRLAASRVKIIGNETRGNSSNNGGGLLLAAGFARLDRTTIEGNRADNVGGGVAVYQGTLKIRRSSIVGNQSGYVGGGLYLGGSTFATDAVKIKESTIAENGAGGNGGGAYIAIYDDEGTEGANLTNVTISGNSSSESGGGIYQYVGQVSLNATTVTRNVADSDSSGGSAHGGGLAGSIQFRNSIVFGNKDLNATDPRPDCYSGYSGGRNVIGDETGCTPVAGDRTTSPRLGPLKRNGGPTATHALKRRSSAIGLAKRKDSPKRDQRGLKRDKRPDSGAYERS